jgi:hypothetical protein
MGSKNEIQLDGEGHEFMADFLGSFVSMAAIFQ